jgi:putative FmdB family regulatory protein
MPVFEYKCSDCGKISEFLERAGNKEKKACSHCGGKKLEKQFSTFAAVVKEQAAGNCHTCPSGGSCPHAH